MQTATAMQNRASPSTVWETPINAELGWTHSVISVVCLSLCVFISLSVYLHLLFFDLPFSVSSPAYLIFHLACFYRDEETEGQKRQISIVTKNQKRQYKEMLLY